jgi:hypothetical protein
LTSSAARTSSDAAQEAIQEEATCQVRNGLEGPSPKTRKRALRTRDGDSLLECGHSKEDGGNREEEDSTPSLVTSGAVRIISDAAQEAIQEEAPHQVRNGSECPPSPKTRKRLRTRGGDSRLECGQETGGTNGRGNANVSSSKKAGGDREEEDSKPSLVTSGAARTISDTVQEEAVLLLNCIPVGHVKSLNRTGGAE